MVDLTAGGVTDPSNVTAEMPSVSYGSAFQRVPKASLAPGLAAIGEGLDALSADLAKTQGQHDAQEAVTRAPDGSLNVVQKPPAIMLGSAARAYTQAVDAGTIPFVNQINAQKLTEIRAQFPNDPAGFSKAASDYADSLKSKWTGPLGLHAYENANSLASQHYDNMLLAEQSRIAAENKQVVLGGIEDATNGMNSLARQSGLGVEKLEQFQKYKDQVEGYYKQLTDNPVFGFSHERAEQEKARLYANIQGSAVIGQVDQIFQKEGAQAAQKKIEEGILNNPGLNLSDQQRAHLTSWGMARIKYLTGQNASQIAAMETTVKQTVAGIRAGVVTDAQADQIVEKMRGLGSADDVQQIEAARSVARAAQPLGMLAPGQQRVAVMDGGAPVGASGVGTINYTYNGSLTQSTNPNAPAPKQMFDYLVSKGASKNEALMLTGAAASESGLNPTAIHDGGIGSGMFGHNGSRLAQMRANTGTLAPNWQQQADFALNELRSRPEGAAVNAAKSVKELADAQMAYEQPQGYKPGSPQTGHNYTGRFNTLNRFAELAGMPASPVAPVSVNGVPFTDAQVKQNPYLLSEWVTRIAANAETQKTIGASLGTAIENGIKSNLLPAADTLANFMQIAAANPKTFADQQQRIVTSLAGMQVAQGAGNMPVSSGQAVIDQAMAQANGGSILQQQVAMAAKQHFEADQKELADHPGYSAARRGWIAAPPAPLNPSNPQALAAGMQQRDAMATAIATHTGNASQSALQPADLDQVKSLMTNGDTNQKLGLISSFGQLSKPTLDATLKQLGSDATTRPLAMAAKVAMDNPEAAKAIVEGQALLKAEPKLGADKDLRETQWAKTLPIADLKDPEIREAISDSVNAVYASLSAKANDMSGAFKKDRYNEAVKLVTGGVLDFRGSKIIAPWYGATDSNLSSAVASLTPADLAGAVAGDGTAFPASMLKPSLGGVFSSGRYRLETLGNGKYLIFSGDDAARRYIQKQGGGAFVLDLAAKKQGASIPSMEHVGGPPLGAILSKQDIWSAGDRKAQDKTAPISIDGGVIQ